MAYFDKHLSTGDYYLSAEREQDLAQWHGQGATRLGLRGSVNRDDFERLANNLDPWGQQLTQRMNRSQNRRTFWDVAVSPPKDISVLAALSDPEMKTKLRELHWKATLETATELESYLGTRVRTDGQDHTKVGNVESVVAAILHDTARPVDGVPDPHLHTHLLFANAVYDRDAGRWKALANDGAVKAQAYGRQFYYNQLVRGLNELGIVTATRESKRDFIIQGLPRNLVEQFSRRHDQVEERAREKMKQGMTHREAAEKLAAIDGREQKVKFSDEELTHLWENMAGEEAIQTVRYLGSQQNSPPLLEPLLRHLESDEALQYVKSHSFENATVLPTHEILADLLKASRGQFTKESALTALKSDPDIITDGKLYSTKQLVNEEQSLLALTNVGKGQHQRLVPKGYGINSGPEGANFTYSREQRKTITGVLQSRDFVLGIQGVAGAGKTTLLKEIERGVLAGGGRLVPLATSGKATDGLRDEGFEEAETFQQWLVNTKLRNTTRNSLIVVDEAGMISVPNLADLLRKAKGTNSRVLLVGDTRQIASVGRGDAFRLLQDHSNMETLHVLESRRQKPLPYREAVGLLRAAGRKSQWREAWDVFEQMNAISEAPGDSGFERSEALLKESIEGFLKDRKQLLVAARWETIRALNEGIRDQLKKEKFLGKKSITREILEPHHLTGAEKRRGAVYEKGQKIELLADLDFGKKGELWTIDGRHRGKLLLRSEQSNEITEVSVKPIGSKINVYNPRRLEFCNGDLVLVRKNSDGLKNGQRGFITEISKEGEIELKVGDKIHRLGSGFRHLMHGYAVTAHASQGTTVDRVSVLADGMNREQFYVAATRGREDLKVHTADRYRFEETVKVSGERKSAIEAFPLERANGLNQKSLKKRFRLKSKVSPELHGALNRIRRKASTLPHWLKSQLTKTNKWQQTQTKKQPVKMKPQNSKGRSL